MTRLRSLTTLWWQIPEQIRFLIVGGWNTFFGLGVFALLMWIWSEVLNFVILLLISNEIAILNAFVAHRLTVFRRIGTWSWAELARYHLIYGIAMIPGLLATYGAVACLNWHPVAAQAATLFVSVIISYLGHRWYSFRQPHGPALNYQESDQIPRS